MPDCPCPRPFKDAAYCDDCPYAIDSPLTPEQEIAKLKHAISGLIPWVASNGRGLAQEALADGCEAIGIDPLAWSTHPDVLLARRPGLNRRGE